MSLSDFFKRKKEVVKEDSTDLIEDLIDDDKDYIKKLEARNKNLNSKFIDSLINLNEYYRRELKSLERFEELSQLNTSLEIENKILKFEIEDLKKDIDLNKMFRNLDKRFYELNEYLKSKDVILNDDDDEDKEEYLDPKSKDLILNDDDDDEDKEEYLDSKSKILKLLKSKDKNIYINPRFKIGFNVLKLSQDTNLSKFTVYKYLRKIKKDML